MSKKDYVTELSENLNQIYSHLGVEIFQNQQKEALKIIDGYKERYKKIVDLETKLAESENKVKEYATEITRRNTEQLDMQTRSFLKIRDLDTEILKLKHQFAEKEKMHLLDENEFQRYCAYKHIEPQIKGCLDREIAYEKEIEELKQSQNQIAIEKLENLKEIINNNAVDFEKGIHIIVTELLIGHIDYQIKKLRGE